LNSLADGFKPLVESPGSSHFATILVLDAKSTAPFFSNQGQASNTSGDRRSFGSFFRHKDNNSTSSFENLERL
jgi:hypothetical protein